MKLQNFIFNSLKEIISGIEDAQKYAAEHGAKINPKSQATVAGEGTRSNISYDQSTGRYIHHINFDIAVTVSEEKEKGVNGGTLGISVVQLGLGIKNKSAAANTEQSRIQFAIPICFPIQESENQIKNEVAITAISKIKSIVSNL